MLLTDPTTLDIDIIGEHNGNCFYRSQVSYDCDGNGFQLLTDGVKSSPFTLLNTADPILNGAQDAWIQSLSPLLRVSSDEVNDLLYYN